MMKYQEPEMNVIYLEEKLVATNSDIIQNSSLINGGTGEGGSTSWGGTFANK